MTFLVDLNETSSVIDLFSCVSFGTMTCVLAIEISSILAVLGLCQITSW